MAGARVVAGRETGRRGLKRPWRRSLRIVLAGRRPGNRSAWIETEKSWPDSLKMTVAGRETGRRGLKHAPDGGWGWAREVAGRETGRRGLKPSVDVKT